MFDWDSIEVLLTSWEFSSTCNNKTKYNVDVIVYLLKIKNSRTFLKTNEFWNKRHIFFRKGLTETGELPMGNEA